MPAGSSLGNHSPIASQSSPSGAGEHEIEFLEKVPGNSSAPEGELWEAIGEWLPTEDPAGKAIPVMLPGYTDSVAFREAYPEITAYGFFPQTNMDIYETSPLVHGADERIDARDVGVAARCYSAVARRLLG